MSKNDETTTITVINTDEFKKLPVATQKLITKLTKDLKVSGLNLLNPLVESMVTIDGFKAIRYDVENDETIQQYKDAKAIIRSFNASTRKAKKAIKAPLLATGKDLDLIEKTFLEEAKEIQEKYLDVEFKPYLDAEEKKKEEALAKKNAATTAKIAELSEETTEQKLAINRSNIYAKYSANINLMLPAVMDKLETFSKQALQQELLVIQNTDCQILDEHKNTLLDDQVANIEKLHQTTIDTCVRLLSSRISELNIEEEKKAAEAAAEAIKTVEKIEMSKPVIAPSVEGFEDFTTVFREHMLSSITFIGNINAKTEKEKLAQKSAVAGLNSYTEKIINYLQS